jgi:alpha-glucosidase (family GH31 glycosyl hydrolase)
MYYQYPDRDEAYEVPNQYIFGSQLLVCPITSPADTKIGLGSVTAWLPERLYVDIFTGMC